MNTFEFNKFAGAFLAALLATTVIGFVGNFLVSPKKLDKPAYVVEGIAVKQDAAPVAAEAKIEPIAPLLAAANAEAGKAAAKPCAACHTFDKGGKNGVGPNLWNVVGGPKAHTQGFSYSAAMQAAAQKAGVDGTWGYEQLSHFLANPKGYLPGTKMAFAGVRKPEDRANLVAYLRTLADNPKPLP
ncbi:MAG: c-type cytochrome [Rhodospirillales bacterium]|nr:c-type cytochrome [Rhodospirillales bacterium]